MSDPIIVIDYDSRWPSLFEEEKRVLIGALGPWTLSIEHIGSTSVPGLAAKPIIDILVAIRDLSLLERCIPALDRVGYEYRGEQGIPGRHFFGKPKIRPRQYDLHMVEYGVDEWWKHLRFRDYLRSHTTVAALYADLKKGFATLYGENREAYTESKSAFILGVLRKAGYPETAESR